MFGTVARTIHVLALGLWFGSAVMFNFISAPAIFESFKEVVATAPSDRTAFQPISSGADEEQRKQLANALAGSAVGPIFPKFFALQGVCGFFALLTACGWAKYGKVHMRRVIVVSIAAITVAVSWPISLKVSELRPLRFSSDSVIAEAAKVDFGNWHIVSLLLSFATAILAGVALAMASKMPQQERMRDEG